MSIPCCSKKCFCLFPSMKCFLGWNSSPYVLNTLSLTVLLPSHPEVLLSFFSFFLVNMHQLKKNVFLICVALYPWRAETLPFMHYRPVCATHGFWAVLVWKGVYIDSEFKKVWFSKKTMRAHKLIWLFTSEWIRKFSSNTTICLEQNSLKSTLTYTKWTR